MVLNKTNLGTRFAYYLLLPFAARREGCCEGAGGSVSPAYASLFRTHPGLDRVARWRERVNGSMCGDSAFGLWSVNSLEMKALAQWVNFGAASDGVVPTALCDAYQGPQAEHAPTASRYTAGVNHYDLTCRNGDGWWGGDRRPCAWYRAMAAAAMAGAAGGV